MQFEILNTIQYLVFLLITAIVYYSVKRRCPKLQWRYYLVSVLFCTVLTHRQFYTLTEITDGISTQNTMLLQSNTLSNNKVVDEYIESQQSQGIDKVNIETLLKDQQRRSKKLALEIEKSYKENK